MASSIVSGLCYVFIGWANLQAVDLSRGPQLSTNGNPVSSWPVHSDNAFSNQLWKAQSVGSGFYSLTNVAGGLVLDEDTGSAKIQGWQQLNGPNQQWSFEPASQSDETPSFFIRGKATGRYVTVPGGAPGQGVALGGRALNNGQQANWSRWVPVQYPC